MGIYKGISAPFRFSPKGGVVMSKAAVSDTTRIKESYREIINTQIQERIMETDFGSESRTFIFEQNDETLVNVIRHKTKEALELHDERTEVEEITVTAEEEKVFINVWFRLKNSTFQDFISVQVR